MSRVYIEGRFRPSPFVGFPTATYFAQTRTWAFWITALSNFRGTIAVIHEPEDLAHGG
jgi:hypothetical protein